MISTAPDGIGTLEALMADLVQEVRGLRADLAVSRRASRLTLTRGDRELLLRIYPVVIGVFGSELVTAREACEHTSPALQLVLRDLNARQLGRLLHRAEGQPIGGYVVQREGVEVGAILWRVLEVPEFSR